MRHKPTLTEAKTDLDALSMGVAGQASTGETGDLAREILEERRNRLRKQNKKLDFEIEIKELAYGDIEQLRRQVLRANETVKQSLFAMSIRISEQLALMDKPQEIQQFLLEQLSQAFNDLAYENSSREAGGV